MNSQVTIKGKSVSLNNKLINIKSLPVSDDVFDLIQATNDSLLIRGLLRFIKNIFKCIQI